MELADLDLSKTYTYADYLKWSFDERLALIKGKIFKMGPAPGSLHQRISLRLSRWVGDYLEGKSCEAFTAPFYVRIPRRSDLSIICDPKKIDDKGCLGAPDLIVEILSPGNNRMELKNKYEVYEEAGVLEYWVIQPTEKTFSRYILKNGRFESSRMLIPGDEVTTSILPGFVLNLDRLFADKQG
jgi:Uma2 family endonuclease